MANYVESKPIYRFFLKVHDQVGLNKYGAMNPRKAAHHYELHAGIASILTWV